MQSINVPSSLKFIGDSAFMYCKGLERLTFSECLESIGELAFAYCFNLKEAILPDSLMEMGDGVFYYDFSLCKATLPKVIEKIPLGTFYCCLSLENIVIPETVTTIGEGAYGCCNIKNLTIPDSVTNIAERAFIGCSIESVELPKKINEIPHEMFLQCDGLKKIIIPNNISSIGSCAFADNRDLNTVIIPDSVTKIGENAFSSCPSLSLISIEAEKINFDTVNESGETISDDYDIIDNENVTFLAKKNTETYDSLVKRDYNVIPYSFTVNKDDKDKPMLALDGKVVLTEDMWSCICRLVKDTDVQYIYFKEFDFGDMMPEYVIVDYDKDEFKYKDLVLSIIKDGDTIRLGMVDEKKSFFELVEALVEQFIFTVENIIRAAWRYIFKHWK